MQQLTQEQRSVENEEKFRKAFGDLHMAAVAVILVRTREPYRVISSLHEFVHLENKRKKAELSFRSWSIVNGWRTYDTTNLTKAPEVDSSILEPTAALKMIDDPQIKWGNGIYVITYPHLLGMNKNPVFIGVLKEYSVFFSENKKRVVLIVPPTYELPTELEDDIAIIDFDPPSFAELRKVYNKVLGALAEGKSPSFKEDEITHILSIGAGMTQPEFENSLSRAMVENQYALPDVTVEQLSNVLSKCKSEVIKKTDILEIMEPISIHDVGGLQPLKDWLEDRKYCFTDEARQFGISSPRGITLVGAPGLGKSLVAKATAHMLGLPLIRFDVSRVFQSLVGSSEARIRNTLKIVETCAPCVTGDTWIRLQNGERKTAESLWKSNAKQTIIETMDPKTGENIESQLIGIIKKPVNGRKILKITAGNRIIKVTENHKMLVWKNDYPMWIEAKNLREGDNLVNYNHVRVNLVNQIFGIRKVIGLAEPKNDISRWHVECMKCGKKSVMTLPQLEKVQYPSCGCAGRHDNYAKTHGMSRSKEYRTWHTIHRRCYEKNFKDYKYYGERGIRVCERWHKTNPSGFQNFFEDIGTIPKGRTIERIDNNKDYSPGNCKIATRKEQANNFRTNKIITWRGETKTLSQWSEDPRIIALGISYTTLRARLNILGWDFDKAATTPILGEAA